MLESCRRNRAGKETSIKPTRRLIICVVVAFQTLMARAEQEGSRSLVEFSSMPTAAEAFSDHYGRAVIVEFGRLLASRADSDCLVPRKIVERDFARVAADILVRYGDQAAILLYPKVEPSALEAAFAALVGPQGVDELRAFARHAGVRQIRLLGKPVRNDTLVDLVVEAFDEHLATAKMSLGARLGSVVSGNQDLADLWEDRSEPLVEYARSVESEDWYERYLDLILYLRTAKARLIEAAGQGVTPSYSAFLGVEADLRAVCVRLN
jgi:hypothetical protein